MAKVGRPTKYTNEMCDKVDEYLQENQDSWEEFHKTRGDKSDTYEKWVTVNLPTVEKFAKYIGVNKTSLYEWSKVHADFSNALEKILDEQKHRLLDEGLAGHYNSTIAKLILSSNHGMVEKSERKIDGTLSLTSLLDSVDEDTEE